MYISISISPKKYSNCAKVLQEKRENNQCSIRKNKPQSSRNYNSGNSSILLHTMLT